MADFLLMSHSIKVFFIITIITTITIKTINSNYTLNPTDTSPAMLVMPSVTINKNSNESLDKTSQVDVRRQKIKSL